MDWTSTLDPGLLARLQFAFTISFHIIFPGFTIGLSAFVATLEILHWRTGREHYLRLSKFWLKVFAVSFAMGVVSGVMLSYQFGTNWARFGIVIGNVVGPLIGYEVLTAFFLESTFLGILLFGRSRVPQWAHVLSACMVAIGTAISAFWIISANSWMHTPAGYELRNGIAFPVDWWAIIFNPSFPYRFAHMLTAAYLSTSVVVLATGARYRMARRFDAEARTMIRMGLGMVLVLAPLQLLIGDQHGLNTLEHQPTKIAAMEAHWSNDGPVPLVLFAWPECEERAQRLRSRDPARRQPDPHPQLGRPHRRPQGRARDRPSAVAVGVLRIPDHGRNRHAADRNRLRRRIPVDARQAVRRALVPAAAGLRVAAGIHRHPRRLDGYRNRAPAVDRDRHPAHRRWISPVPAATVLTSFVMIVIYTVVFSIGIYYMRKLLRHGPQGAAVAASAAVASPNSPLAAAASAAREAADGEQVI